MTKVYVVILHTHYDNSEIEYVFASFAKARDYVLDEIKKQGIDIQDRKLVQINSHQLVTSWVLHMKTYDIQTWVVS